MFDGLRKKLSDAVKGFIKKEEPEIREEARIEEQKMEEKKQEVKADEKKQKQAEKPVPEVVAKKQEAQKEQKAVHKLEEKKQDSPAVKLSLTTKLKGVFSSSVTLNESEIETFTDGLKLSLLESDVSYETTEEFIDDLTSNLKTAKIEVRNIQQSLFNEVRRSLFDILNKSGKGPDIEQAAKEHVKSGNLPLKILFLGPNGTGKTTTIAKIAHRFKKSGISTVLSASDTFRAAAIEQTEHHANKVGVPVIKSKYGADPASIAFDAIAYAKAHNIQTVLIDSAGRQETNKNLISEMQKIVRVAQPDLVIFVGESTAGNVLANQIQEFNKFIKINGIVLTKLDCDAKGGNAISIANTTGIPLIFLGTGESYDALIPYTPEFIVDAILPNN